MSPVAPAEEAVNRILAEFAIAEGKRGIWNGHWEEVALKVLPYYSTSFYTQGNIVPGAKRNQDMFDTTANAALWKFAAFMESMLSPASGKWHRMRPIDPLLARNNEAMQWYDTVNDLLFRYRYSPHSGFQANQHEAYVSLGAFGTSCLFVDAFKDPTMPGTRGLRYRNVPLGEVYFSANHQGQVDKVFRRFRMTLRQLAQRWGEGKLPEGLRQKLPTSPEQEVYVIHCVCPNVGYEAGRIDAKGKRFASHYVLKDERVLMEEGGYRTMPYAVARYLTAPGELYGRSPAMNVLPNINVLQDEKKTILKQGHRAVDQILLMHDDGIMDTVSLRPGALIGGGVNADGRPLVHPLPVGDLSIGKELMDDERVAINDAFMVTLFQILVETPQMTATEVLERAREKGAMLSPAMGRYQSEAQEPMILREFDLLTFQNLIPPPPQVVLDAGGEYKIEFDAMLNRAMRAEEASGIMRTMQWAAEIAAQTQDPSALDWFDTDVIIPELADISGSPFRFIASADKVAAKRQGRAQDKAAAQITQALPGMAGMLKAAAPQGVSPSPGQPQ